MNALGTRYRFRHTRLDPDGARRLIWASSPDGPLLDVPDHELDRAPVLADPGGFYRPDRRALEVVRLQPWTPNALADEGEKDILDVYFDDVAVRASLWFSLWNDTPLETDTLSTLTGEVSGTGYARIEVVRGTDWSDPTLDAGDMQTVSTTKTFTAGGNWTAATQLVLSTTSDNTGLFLAWAALSATRTLVNGDTLDVSLAVKAQ